MGLFNEVKICRNCKFRHNCDYDSTLRSYITAPNEDGCPHYIYMQGQEDAMDELLREQEEFEMEQERARREQERIDRELQKKLKEQEERERQLRYQAYLDSLTPEEKAAYFLKQEEERLQKEKEKKEAEERERIEKERRAEERRRRKEEREAKEREKAKLRNKILIFSLITIALFLLAGWVKGCGSSNNRGNSAETIDTTEIVSSDLIEEELVEPVDLDMSDAEAYAIDEELDQLAEIEKSEISSLSDNPYLWLSTRRVRSSDVSGLPKSELRILRNAIYAMHGRRFKSKDLAEYFAQYDWYTPFYDEVEDQLNSTERENIKIIKAYE